LILSAPLSCAFAQDGSDFALDMSGGSEGTGTTLNLIGSDEVKEVEKLGAELENMNNDNYVPDPEVADAAEQIGNLDLKKSGELKIDGSQDEASPILNLWPTPSIGVKILPNFNPLWSWDGTSLEGNFRYRLDDETGYTETTETSFTPEEILAPGMHTLYVQEKFGKTWSQDASSAISVVFPSPVVNVDRLPSVAPVWTWEGASEEGRFRYRLDDEEGYTETSELTYTPEEPLKPGHHVLYVSEGFGEYWSDDASAETVIFPLDVSQTDYLKNLPTGTAHTELLPIIIKFLLSIGGLLAFVSFVYSGIWMIIYADQEEEVSNAKRNLIYSIMGLAVMGLAYSAVAGILKLI